MHFLADHAIKSCHQSRSLPVRLSGGEGDLGRAEAGRARKEIKLQWRARVRAPAVVAAGKGVRGAVPAPARVFLAAAAASVGWLLFLYGSLGQRHVAVLARTPGLKEREPEQRPHLPAAGGALRRHLPEPQSSGTGAQATLPCGRLGLLLFSKCISRPEPFPAPPLPAGPSLRGPCAGGGQGLRAQLLPRPAAGKWPRALCCKGERVRGPGSWTSVGTGFLGGG